jgi:hypothetical protein
MFQPRHDYPLRVLTLATLLLVSPSGPALAEAKDICRGFAVQPKTFANLKFVNFKQYENKAYGVFIKFKIPNRILSVFKYDDGQTHISDAYLQERLKASKKSLEKAVVKRGDKIVNQAKPLVWKMGNVLFHGVSYRVTYKKHKIMAYEYVGLSHDTACMLKVRYTDGLETSLEGSLKRYKSYARNAHGIFVARKEPKIAAQHIFTAIRGGDTLSLEQMNTNANAWSKDFRHELQRLMKQAGFYDGPIDGDFGPGTKRALLALAE